MMIGSTDRIFRNRLPLLATFVLTLLAYANVLSQTTAKDKPTLLALVNGDSITTANIEMSFNSLHATMSTEEKATFDYRKLLNKLVNDRLLVQEAEALNMDQESSVTKLLAKRLEEYATARYIKTHFVPKDSVSDAEVTRFFLANFGKRQVRTVSVETKEKAAALMAKVRRGASMDSLAQAVSMDIHRYHGGLHPPVYEVTLDPELKTVAMNTKVKQLAGPFPFRKVYAFLRVEQVLPPDTSELPKVKSAIVTNLQTEKRNREWRVFLTDLRRQYPVVVDSSALVPILKTANVALDSTFMKGSGKIVATIAGQATITDNDLRQRIAHQRMAANTLGVDSLTRQTLDEAINDIVLARAARDAGSDKEPTVLRKLGSTRDSLLIELYLKETLVSKIKFSHQEFSDYYNSHLDDFRMPAEYNLKQVQVATKAGADSIVALVKDGADFNFVVKRALGSRSNVDEKDEWISTEAFPQSIQDDIARTPNGGITGPYQTGDGWIILKIKERRPGKIKDQSEAEMQIREIIFQKKFDEGLDGILGALKKSSKIVYLNDAINNYFGKGQTN
jgi:parvulin-like peptidyl-prolyl isomerase